MANPFILRMGQGRIEPPTLGFSGYTLPLLPLAGADPLKAKEY